MMYIRIFIMTMLLSVLYSCSDDTVEKPVSNGLVAGVYKLDKAITFVYIPESLEITNVALIGDFNSWNPGGVAMNLIGRAWTVTLNLPYGIYQYKYVLNGKIFVTDPFAEAYAPDGRGDRNSIVEVRKE